MALLEARGVVKRFGKRAAVDGASLSAAAGRIVAVLGENGAGKTTLMRVLAGELEADSASLVIGGWTWISGARRMRKRPPVALVHQHPLLADDLTVAENVFLGREPLALGFIAKRNKMREMARELIEEFSLGIDPDARAGELSFADRQRTELLRAMSHRPSVLILDEPTSNLSEEEADRLFVGLAALKAGGTGIVLVTHRIREAIERADSFMVMRDGKTTLETNAADQDLLVRAMFGERSSAGDEAPGSDGAERAETVLEVERLTTERRTGDSGLDDVSFSVDRGRVLCALSITGNGERSLEDAISGMERRARGSIRFLGTEVVRSSPEKRRARGMAYVPRERMKRGVATGASIADNILIHESGAYAFPGLGKAARSAMAAKALSGIGIRADPADDASTLSGGQIQRLVLERELSLPAALVVIAEPTWGMDAKRAAECRKRIREEARKGKAFFIALSQIGEALELADEIVVLSRGRVTLRAVNDGSAGIEDRIRQAMTGGAP